MLPPLLEGLSPSEASPTLIVATLRSLHQIADAILQEAPWADTTDGPLPKSLAHTVCEQLYIRPVVENLNEILSQPVQKGAQAMRAMLIQQQIALTAGLITKTCQEETHRRMLLDAGILDQLASKLAAMAAVDAKLATIPVAEARGLGSDVWRSTWQDQLPISHLPDLLEAISTIIKGSHYRAARFVYSQSIQSVFGSPGGFSTSSQMSPWEKLTPRLQAMQQDRDKQDDRDFRNTFPPLANSRNHKILDEPENPLFLWLMFVARRGEGRTRLSACWLLAFLRHFGEKWPLNDPSKDTRDKYFAFLIVPLLVKMIDEAKPGADLSKKSEIFSAQSEAEKRFMLERAPLVLADVIAGSVPLQQAAFDAKIVSALVQILKKSFDPITSSSKQLWAPKSYAPDAQDPNIDPQSSRLGSPGLSPEIIHAFKYRESALLALAAVGDTEIELRKAVLESGATNHLPDCLIPLSNWASPSDVNMTPKSGNPVPVLVAACTLVRSLSRSVSTLRTKIVDHDVAEPIFQLMGHSNRDVQLAATKVATNLVLEFSPSRYVSLGNATHFELRGLVDLLTKIQLALQKGVLKQLCEQCRSADLELRFSSIWALKHFVYKLETNESKSECLEELGVGWLVQALKGNPSSSAAPMPLGMGTSNAAGEQVDLLNAIDEPHMDIDDDQPFGVDEDSMSDTIPGMRRHQRSGSRYTSSVNIHERLQQIKNDEQDPRLAADRDDIRIQEQALDFLRNFTTSTDKAEDMIDHLVRSIGHSNFFEILDSKIRPKSASSASPLPSSPSYWANQRPPSFTQNNAPPTSNWSAYPPAEIIYAAIMVLVHIANGRPHHRALLLAQTPIMTHLLPLTWHPSNSVRNACIWFCINCLHQDDTKNDVPAKERARLLSRLGFEDAAKRLLKDEWADNREKANLLNNAFGKLLGNGTGGSGGMEGESAFESAAASSSSVFGGGSGSGGGAGAASGSGSTSNSNSASGSGDGAGGGLGSRLGGNLSSQFHRAWGGRDGAI